MHMYPVPLKGPSVYFEEPEAYGVMCSMGRPANQPSCQPASQTASEQASKPANDPANQIDWFLLP